MSILPARIRILYLIMGVLLLVSVVPMYFFADRVVAVQSRSFEGQRDVDAEHDLPIR